MKREGPENVEVERIVKSWFRSSNGVAETPVQLYEIAQGIEYLHAQGVIHGDLRGSNVLVDSGHHPRLADFGLGTISEATTGSHTAKGGGSIRWMAPELLRAEGDFQRTLPTDVYSYGCICVEACTFICVYREILMIRII
jgi:serine/threonine protein kinase